MTLSLDALGVDLVLLDIEGTTTPLAFVQEILFPFVRGRLASWIDAHVESANWQDIVRDLAREHADDQRGGAPVPAWPSPATDPRGARHAPTAYLRWLMDQDRKSPALKRLQGLICEDGYRTGELRGEVYPDVPAAMARWCSTGRRIAIYSSGSELAQRLLFGSVESEHGPPGAITQYISAYFDTGVGAKVEPASYRRIASIVGLPAAACLFVSDVTRELSAAADAGLQIALAVRPGNQPQRDASRYQAIRSFDEIV